MTKAQDLQQSGGNAPEDVLVVAQGQDPGSAPPVTPQKVPRKARRLPPRGSRTGLRWRLVFLFAVLGLVVGGYGLIGRAIPLPVFVVAEIEARLNRSLADSLPDASLALGSVDLTLDDDMVPRLRIEDVRLLKSDGTALLTLPELRLTLQGRALL